MIISLYSYLRLSNLLPRLLQCDEARVNGVVLASLLPSIRRSKAERHSRRKRSWGPKGCSWIERFQPIAPQDQPERYPGLVPSHLSPVAPRLGGRKAYLKRRECRTPSRSASPSRTSMRGTLRAHSRAQRSAGPAWLPLRRRSQSIKFLILELFGSQRELGMVGAAGIEPATPAV